MTPGDYYKHSPAFYDHKIGGDLLHHVFPESGILSHVGLEGISFVGRTEQMDADWEGMLRRCGVDDLGALDAQRGQHESSGDPLGTYAAAKELLASDCAAYCTVYHLLIGDFACFGYQPKPECGCHDAGAAHVRHVGPLRYRFKHLF